MTRTRLDSALAIDGGPRVKKDPFGSGQRYGEAEMQQLSQALAQQTLFYSGGTKVAALCQQVAARLGVRHATAVSSGTAAVHSALAAAGVRPGDHVVTSPISDAGTVIGILFQGAVPLFADLDPHTYSFDLDSLADTIDEKTRVVMPVHLGGTPGPMDDILGIARERGCLVIEDCAQAWGATYKGRPVGSLGDLGTFSLNESKQISCGDGGLVVADSDELARGARLFADKFYDREAEVLISPAFLGANYRMTELQAAVSLAQLEKLDNIVERRVAQGERLTEGLAGIPGLYPMLAPQGAQSSYWFYLFRIDPAVLGVDNQRFAEAVSAEGVPCLPGYIKECIYQWDMLAKKQVFPGTSWPLAEVDYGTGLCPMAESILATSARLVVSEFHTDQDVEDQIAAVRKVASHYSD